MSRRPSANTPPGAPDMNAAWDAFVIFLRQRQSRITRARRIVMERALARTDHFRADEIAADLAAGRNRVSRGTVYRTLALMVESGLLRQMRDSDLHYHYERAWGQTHHEHLVCDRCGAFIEFEDPALLKRLQKACQERDFIQRAHRVVVFGLCSECRKGGA